MWSLRVVVGGVLGRHAAEVPLAEDQHAVGDLGADGQYEAFGEAVRLRTARRDLDHVDAGIGQHRVERGRELSGPVADENRNRPTCSARSMTRLRACWVVQGPSGCAVTPRMCR